MMKGIDVAKWNGVIDWAKVKKAGVEFAVLKVIDKSNKTESSFVRNYAGASAQGLPLDVYNYLYTTTEAAAREAAKAVVNALAGRKIGKVWADAEDACLKNKGIQLIRILNSYKAVIEAAMSLACILGCPFTTVISNSTRLILTVSSGSHDIRAQRT